MIRFTKNLASCHNKREYLIYGKRGSQNALMDGFRYTQDGKKNGRTYLKCVMQGTCKARIILDEDQQLSSPIPVHSHTSQEAAIEVCKAKNNIKRLASTTDNTTKNIIASSLSTDLLFNKLYLQIYYRFVIQI